MSYYWSCSNKPASSATLYYVMTSSSHSQAYNVQLSASFTGVYFDLLTVTMLCWWCNVSYYWSCSNKPASSATLYYVTTSSSQSLEYNVLFKAYCVFLILLIKRIQSFAVLGLQTCCNLILMHYDVFLEIIITVKYAKSAWFANQALCCFDEFKSLKIK